MTETAFGIHASHEQFPPGELIELMKLAGKRGFAHASASDHFHPWSDRQGESGHVWSWLGAAMQATDLTFGTVNAPGYRYHPAIVAQAAATLRSMFPDRFWVALGSGELLNEGITGERWPIKADRNERLRECGSVMRSLWAGETVTHHGQVTVERATLYTRPDSPPPLIGAALSVETAERLAEWADGLITIATPDHAGDAAVVEAFRGRAPDKPVYMKAQLSYAEQSDEAIDGAYEQWRTVCLPGPGIQSLRTPADFDAVGDEITQETVRKHIAITASADELITFIDQHLDAEPDRLYLHNVNTNQSAFVEWFDESVRPSFE